MFRISLYILLVLLLTLQTQKHINAQTNDDGKVYKAKIVEVIESSGEVQKAKIEITEGQNKGKEVEASATNIQKSIEFNKGDEILVLETKDVQGEQIYYITDFSRTNYLYILFAIFAILSVFIAGVKGISSLIGLGASFLIIFKFILPFIDRGYEPVTITIIGSIFIVATTFYLSHGFNKKTSISVVGTIISLIITGLLALIFISKAKITGSASEELIFLQAMRPGEFNATGLLLSGIIIGTLGILDDITISQASIVQELKKANPDISGQDLFIQTMSVGKDHIASLVNTLILVYTGSFLPLLLLLNNNPQPFSQVINYEIFAEEIIRTLVASIGLILAVPITTALATLVATNFKSFWESSEEHHHYH